MFDPATMLLAGAGILLMGFSKAGFGGGLGILTTPLCVLAFARLGKPPIFAIGFVLPLLVTICLVSSLAFASLGLLIASRAQTMEGASGLMNLVMLPMWIFSGVFFSAARFPEPIQPFIQALPLTAVINALRANILRGADWHTVTGELAIIGAWMVGSFLLALKLFRWR